MAGSGETAWDVGRRRAAREEGSFSYRNATIIEYDGECAGCHIGYEVPDDPAPIADDMPAMLVPLQELSVEFLRSSFLVYMAANRGNIRPELKP